MCELSLEELKTLLFQLERALEAERKEAESLTRQVIRQKDNLSILTKRLRDAGMNWSIGENDKPSIGEQKHE